MGIGYMFLFFLRGNLPWRTSGFNNMTERNHSIADAKEKFCACLGDRFGCFPKYMRYVLSLGFTERPDYDMIQSLWRGARHECGDPRDHQYEFFESASKEQGVCLKELIPLEPRKRVTQPDSPSEDEASSETPSTPATVQARKRQWRAKMHLHDCNTSAIGRAQDGKLAEQDDTDVEGKSTSEGTELSDFFFPSDEPEVPKHLPHTRRRWARTRSTTIQAWKLDL